MNLKFDIPQNWCFVRGFRTFSSHLTKCHACHGICTLSPLHAALTWGLAKDTQHNASEVLCLPRKMRMEVSKVQRLPRKTQLIFCKRCKSIAPATQNGFRHAMILWNICWNVTKYHACHVKRSYATFQTANKNHFCRARHRHGHSDPIATARQRLPTVAVAEAWSSKHRPPK